MAILKLGSMYRSLTEVRERLCKTHDREDLMSDYQIAIDTK